VAAPIFQVPQQPQFKAGVADENSDVLFGGEAERVLECFMLVTVHQAYGPGIVAILSLFECAFDHPEWVRAPSPISFRDAASRGSSCWSICRYLDLGYRALGDD